MMKPSSFRFLVVGESAGPQWCERQLKAHDYEAIRVPGGLAALHELRLRNKFAAFFCGTELPDVNVSDFMKQARLLAPRLSFIVIPAKDPVVDQREMLELHQAGASDCLWTLDWERLRTRIELIINTSSSPAIGASSLPPNTTLPSIHSALGGTSSGRLSPSSTIDGSRVYAASPRAHSSDESDRDLSGPAEPGSFDPYDSPRTPGRGSNGSMRRGRHYSGSGRQRGSFHRNSEDSPPPNGPLSSSAPSASTVLGTPPSSATVTKATSSSPSSNAVPATATGAFASQSPSTSMMASPSLPINVPSSQKRSSTQYRRDKLGMNLPSINLSARAAVADEIRTIVRWFQASPSTRLGSDPNSHARFEELAGLLDNILPARVTSVVLDNELDIQSSAWISSQFCKEDDTTGLTVTHAGPGTSPLARGLSTTASTVSLTESSSGGSSVGLAYSHGSASSYDPNANPHGSHSDPSDTLNLESISQVGSNPASKVSTLAETYWSRDPAELRKAKAELVDITFDCFSFSEMELVPLVIHMFQYWRLLERFNIPLSILENFVITVQRNYNASNDFHNWYHAFDVTQTVFCIMANRKMRATHHNLSEQDRLVLLIAALCHDLQHPGHNNAFEVATGSELAFLYNDQAVLENHHAHTAFVIMSNPATDILGSFAKDRRRQIRKSIIDCILATDMKIHFQLVNQFNDVKYSGKTADERQQLMCLLVHAADISNVGKPLSLAKKWGTMVQEEFFKQGDLERKLGLPISPFMDRQSANTVTMTKNFIDLITMPTFQALSRVFPATSLFLENMRLYRKRLSSQDTASQDNLGTTNGGGPGGKVSPPLTTDASHNTPHSPVMKSSLSRSLEPGGSPQQSRILKSVSGGGVTPTSGSGRTDSDNDSPKPRPPNSSAIPSSKPSGRRKLSVISIGLDGSSEPSDGTFSPLGGTARELPQIEKVRRRSNSFSR